MELYIFNSITCRSLWVFRLRSVCSPLWTAPSHRTLHRSLFCRRTPGSSENPPGELFAETNDCDVNRSFWYLGFEGTHLAYFALLELRGHGVESVLAGGQQLVLPHLPPAGLGRVAGTRLPGVRRDHLHHSSHGISNKLIMLLITFPSFPFFSHFSQTILNLNETCLVDNELNICKKYFLCENGFLTIHLWDSH